MQNWQPQSQAPIYGQPVSPPPGGFPTVPHYGTVGYPVPPYMQYPSEARFTYASFWRRFVAISIDWLVCAAILVPAYIVQASIAAFNTGETNDVGLGNLIVVLFYSLPLVYHVCMTTRGGSLGYRAMSLRVTTAGGTRPSVSQALLRQYPLVILVAVQVVVTVGTMLFSSWQNSNAIGLGIALLGLFVLPPIVWFLGCLVSIFDSRNQALHDKIADTYAIQQRY